MVGIVWKQRLRISATPRLSTRTRFVCISASRYSIHPDVVQSWGPEFFGNKLKAMDDINMIILLVYHILLSFVALSKKANVAPMV